MAFTILENEKGMKIWILSQLVFISIQLERLSCCFLLPLLSLLHTLENNIYVLLFTYSRVFMHIESFLYSNNCIL